MPSGALAPKKVSAAGIKPRPSIPIPTRRMNLPSRMPLPRRRPRPIPAMQREPAMNDNTALVIMFGIAAFCLVVIPAILQAIGAA